MSELCWDCEAPDLALLLKLLSRARVNERRGNVVITKDL